MGYSTVLFMLDMNALATRVLPALRDWVVDGAVADWWQDALYVSRAGTLFHRYQLAAWRHGQPAGLRALAALERRQNRPATRHPPQRHGHEHVRLEPARRRPLRRPAAPRSPPTTREFLTRSETRTPNLLIRGGWPG
jgi:hypothetical protein